MKKLISLVLALALVLASCAVAFAADPAYKITVKNTNTRISIEGKEYKAYKIFDAIYGDGDAVSYTVTADNYYYKNAKSILDTYFDFTVSPTDANKYIVTVKTAKDPLSADDARNLADALLNKVPANEDGKGTGTSSQIAEISVPAAGYYLVTGSIKSVKNPDKTSTTAIALVPVKDDKAETIPKADIPDLDKQITAVKENGTAVDDAILDAEGKAAVAKVGSVEEYSLTSTAPDLTGYTDYVYTFHDSMSNGLTYNKNAKVYVDGVELDASKYSKTENDSGFELTIPFATLRDEMDPGDEVVVKYSATVNSNALTYDFEHNTAYLEYTPGPGQDKDRTPDEITYSIDINVDVNKYTTVDETNTPLANAQFKLFKGAKTADQETAIFYKWDATNGKVTWVNKAEADTFTTNAQGKLEQQVRGLDKGTYCLLETQAPSGFNQLAEPVEFTIAVSETKDTNGKRTVTYTVAGYSVTDGVIDLSTAHEVQPVATIDVLNQSGTELPSTGGIGTTIFYIVGGILLIGAAVILVARRKAQD